VLRPRPWPTRTRRHAPGFGSGGRGSALTCLFSEALWSAVWPSGISSGIPRWPDRRPGRVLVSLVWSWRLWSGSA